MLKLIIRRLGKQLKEINNIRGSKNKLFLFFIKKNLPINNKETGRYGEELALKFLRNKGYKILRQNFIPKFSRGINRSEIDIIAKKQQSIIFVEVKALKVDCLDEEKFFPEDKVNFHKLKQIKKAVDCFLSENGLSFENQKCQIDILSVLIHKYSNQIKIKHFKNVS